MAPKIQIGITADEAAAMKSFARITKEAGKLEKVAQKKITIPFAAATQKFALFGKGAQSVGGSLGSLSKLVGSSAGKFAMLGKIAGPVGIAVGALGGAILSLIEMFLKSEDHFKKMMRASLEAVGGLGAFGTSLDGAMANLMAGKNTLQDTTLAFHSLETNILFATSAAERMQVMAVISKDVRIAVDSVTGSMQKASGDVSLLAAGMSKVWGKSVMESAETFREFAFSTGQQGSDLLQTLTTITQEALESGIGVNRFVGEIQKATSDMGLYTSVVGASAKALKGFTKSAVPPTVAVKAWEGLSKDIDGASASTLAFVLAGKQIPKAWEKAIGTRIAALEAELAIPGLDPKRQAIANNELKRIRGLGEQSRDGLIKTLALNRKSVTGVLDQASWLELLNESMQGANTGMDDLMGGDKERQNAALIHLRGIEGMSEDTIANIQALIIGSGGLQNLLKDIKDKQTEDATTETMLNTIKTMSALTVSGQEVIDRAIEAATIQIGAGTSKMVDFKTLILKGVGYLIQGLAFLGDVLAGGFANLLKGINALWQALPEWLRGSSEGISDSAIEQVEGLAKVLGELKKVGMAVVGVADFQEKTVNLQEGLKGEMKVLQDKVKAGTMSQGDMTKAVSEKMKTFGMDVQTAATKIPKMAAGGMVTRPTVALLGERGPEMVLPAGAAPAGAGAAGATVNLTVNVTASSGDGHAIARVVAQEVRRIMVSEKLTGRL